MSELRLLGVWLVRPRGGGLHLFWRREAQQERVRRKRVQFGTLSVHHPGKDVQKGNEMYRPWIQGSLSAQGVGAC